ncbi:hypothetical protein [Mucilaginibacter pocheonensis]|uniref:Uncharacterized protein n=1 Tax=Mucilaginibacter pocheonensis TaxID=398050 RepID=A0ABU1TCM9_9SPHI|nr:hypothetical protein [Mucilaginibacter pocheonensis]MDR6942950.1 hypothetical protein [Mucilaginibacter pocheonensis]
MKILKKNETILEYRVNVDLEETNIEASHQSTRSYQWRNTASGTHILSYHINFSANVKESNVMLIFYRSRLELEINLETEEKDLEEIAAVIEASTDAMIAFITQNSLSYASIIGLEYHRFEGPHFEGLKNSYQILKSLPRFEELTEEGRNIQMLMAKQGQNLNIRFNN